MYEDQTYEAILQRMLDRVSDSLDKREGSIIYNALTPTAAELAQVYIELREVENRTYADRAVNEDLRRRAAERGIIKKVATPAIRKGIFTGNGGIPFNPPLNSRFSGDGLNFIVKEKIADGEFRLECETAGEIGNSYIGQILPIQYIEGLETANLTDVLIPGEEEESNESLRQRYFASLESQSFGGNIADYKDITNKLPGVGGTKVYPAWNGGGSVKLVIIDSTFSKPSSVLIDEVQTAIDPLGNQGQGLGLAPIGHIVTVAGVEEMVINVVTSLTYQDGYTWNDVKPGVENAITEYLLELSKTWADNNNLVVRISQIEAKVLNVTGVLDIQNTKINGVAQNFVLTDTEIPVLGEVTVS
jgi:uncharacterized phage protein gp47/JayE